MRIYHADQYITFHPPVFNLVGSTVQHVCKFDWIFDDGEVQSGAVVKKKWLTNGIHKAWCTAFNNESGLSDTQEVSVYIGSKQKPAYFSVNFSAPYCAFNCIISDIDYTHPSNLRFLVSYYDTVFDHTTIFPDLSNLKFGVIL